MGTEVFSMKQLVRVLADNSSNNLAICKTESYRIVTEEDLT